jgi:hypothetical protein
MIHRGKATPQPPGTTEQLLTDISQKLDRIRFFLRGIYETVTGRFQAEKAWLTVRQKGNTMNAILTFADGGGDPAAPPAGDGSGLVITFSSDNPAVTIGAATPSGDTATAPITGTEAFNLSAVVANVSGVPLLDDDGSTPFDQPSTIPVAATTPPPPQAVTAILSVG